MTINNLPPESPIYIYGSSSHKGEIYTSHPGLVQENIARLNEYSVDPKRIKVIKDPASLEHALSLNQKCTLILVGGYTPFLAKELESVYPKITEAVRKGMLNIWGQCAGANVICQELSNGSNQSRHSENIKQIRLLPLVADTAVYPIQKDKTPGDLANRKIIKLESNENRLFNSIWHRGSHFKFLPNIQNSEIGEITPLAYYADIIKNEKIDSKPIAAICGFYKTGSTVIASGPHPEAVEADVPPSEALKIKQIGSDEGRKEHLKTIYKILGIIPKEIQKNKIEIFYTPQIKAFSLQNQLITDTNLPRQIKIKNTVGGTKQKNLVFSTTLSASLKTKTNNATSLNHNQKSFQIIPSNGSSTSITNRNLGQFVRTIHPLAKTAFRAARFKL